MCICHLLCHRWTNTFLMFIFLKTDCWLYFCLSFEVNFQGFIKKLMKRKSLRINIIHLFTRYIFPLISINHIPGSNHDQLYVPPCRSIRLNNSFNNAYSRIEPRPVLHQRLHRWCPSRRRIRPLPVGPTVRFCHLSRHRWTNRFLLLFFKRPDCRFYYCLSLEVKFQAFIKEIM